MIFIQKHKDLSIPSISDSASALYGALDLGVDHKTIHLIPYENLDSGEFFTKNILSRNLFIGSVEFMRKVFNKLGIEDDPRVPENSNRPSVVMKLEEALTLSHSKKIFVKPVKIKEFGGMVIDEYSRSCFNNIDKGIDVLVYDAFPEKIGSEHRCYIYNNKLVGVKDYSGDPYHWTHNEGFARRVARENSNRNFPVAYTIDVAVLHDGEHVVVEYNDMWAIGNYGLENDTYYRMLKDRYFEIIRTLI